MTKIWMFHMNRVNFLKLLALECGIKHLLSPHNWQNWELGISDFFHFELRNQQVIVQDSQVDLLSHLVCLLRNQNNSGIKYWRKS